MLLDKEFIQQKIANPNIELELFNNIDSTNNYLKQNISTKRRICISESQSNGKGSKLNRTWHSPFGQNIYMSYAYYFKKNINDLSGLSLVVSMAMLAAIKEIGIAANIMLKWPNDGVYKKRKLMGNLIESQIISPKETVAIIGIGINVNMLNAEKDDISQAWTSLKAIIGEDINRNLLCVSLVHNLNAYLEQFNKYGLREFILKWQQVDMLYDQEVLLDNGKIKGIAKGIDEQGNLLLHLANQEIISNAAGDVSIFKI